MKKSTINQIKKLAKKGAKNMNNSNNWVIDRKNMKHCLNNEISIRAGWDGSKLAERVEDTLMFEYRKFARLCGQFKIIFHNPIALYQAYRIFVREMGWNRC